MSDVDLVRSLCHEISEEEDQNKVEELLSLLQAVIREDQEEVKLRIRYLAKKYAAFLAA